MIRLARDYNFDYMDKKICDFCGRCFDIEAELSHHETTKHPVGVKPQP